MQAHDGVFPHAVWSETFPFTLNRSAGGVTAEPGASSARPVRGGGLRGSSVHGAVRDAALRHPAEAALDVDGQAFSYAWLEDVAARVAGALFEAGVSPGDVVALHLERSPGMVAAMLGVLKAGAAYLPLDPDFPPERLALVVEDAAPTLVLIDDALGAGPASAAPRLRLEDALAGEGPHAGVLPDVGPDDLAYVLYTSGSTGRPKGVEITHGAVLNLLGDFAEGIGFRGGDRFLASTTTAFDLSVLELFLPLAAGGTAVLAGRAELKDPQALIRLLDGVGCRFAQATPSKWRYLIEAGWRGGSDMALLCGGEALGRELADLLLARCGRLWNVYGPTETTVWSTRGEVAWGLAPPSIGRPIRNTSLHVLDPDGHPAAPGGEGELYIGGDGLARGYRGRPDLTRERFVVREGERLYRTGDLVRRLPDGTLQCVGRTDHQVKIRGHRVELGEVEAALLSCEGVAMAAAVAWPHRDEVELVGYVVAQGERRLDLLALRQSLGRRLPGYMTPARLLQLPVMPLTPNGKVDRKALPEPPQERAEAEVDGEGLSRTQARLAAIWRDILGVAAVGAGDNFFDLGGYSLLILKLFRRIEEAFGRSLTMADLFAAADLRAMAVLLDAAPAAAVHQDGLIALQPEGERPPLIWFDVGPQLMPLARSLAPHQPFLGLNLEGPAAEALARSRPDAEAVARALINALKRCQLVGPYYLGGWCRWGVIAFEVARRLEAAGEEVRLLVMLDAVNGASRYLAVRRWARSAWRRAGGRTAARPAAAAPELPAVLTTEVEAASRRYRPRPFGGGVLLLYSKDGEPDLDGCGGWRSAVRGDLSVYRASSDHAGVLKTPHVEALGDVLVAALARAQGRGD